MADINITRLQQLCGESELALTVFKTLSERERPRPVTDLRRLRLEMVEAGGRPISASEFREVFDELTKLGLGSVVVGRHNNPDRFKWNYNMVDLARKVLAQKVAAPSAGPRGAGPAPGWLRTAFPIRGGLVELELPVNMTKAEANELADYIKRFGRS